MKYFLTAIVVFFTVVLPAQTNIIKEADNSFNNSNYKSALSRYLSFNSSKPGNPEVLSKIGQCYMFLGQMAEAKEYFSAVIQNTKEPDPRNHLFLANCLHQQHDFQNAVISYKAFLRGVKGNHPQKRSIIDKIKRCASGIQNEYRSIAGLVDNMGNAINSSFDEINPVLSPNYNNRIYFTSENRIDSIKASREDIYAASQHNGIWASPIRFEEPINSRMSDHILGFSTDGQTMYYRRGADRYNGDVMENAFSNDSGATTPYFISPLQPNLGDSDLFLFDDKLILFSSERKSGYGGKDLYWSQKIDGIWSEPKNLGPQINSPYNDINPFLCNDGKTLYYSCNNTKSVGGYDIFKAVYNENNGEWQHHENLGLPINSAGDELHFKISKEGTNAYFSSDRVGGFGGLDLYIIYYESYLQEQKAKGEALFTVANESNIAGADEDSKPAALIEGSANKAINVAPLYYNSNTTLESAANKIILKQLVTSLSDFPQSKIELSGHADDSSPAGLGLYASLKKAEELAIYLEGRGISKDRIIVKGLGQNYPVIRNKFNSQIVPLSRKLNNRIDFKIIDDGPLEFNVVIPPVNNPQLELQGRAYYNSIVDELSYKVEIAVLSNMYNGSVISEYPDPMVEKLVENGNYAYTVGLYNTYISANYMKEALEEEGIANARVIPYFNGERMTVDEVNALVAQYEDLQYYLQSLQ